MLAILLSVASIAISIAAAYYSRESWYSSVAVLVMRNGTDGATSMLIEAGGFSLAKAQRNVAKAIAKHPECWPDGSPVR